MMADNLLEFSGRIIYLDTMILYSFVRPDKTLRPVLREFFRRIEQGNLIAHTSVLTFDELSYRLLLAAIRDKYPDSPLDRLREHETEMMAEFYPRVIGTVRRLSLFPNIVTLSVTPDMVQTMMDLMERHRLRPRDALHLASVHSGGSDALASNDTSFDRAPGVSRFELRP